MNSDAIELGGLGFLSVCNAFAASSARRMFPLVPVGFALIASCEAYMVATPAAVTPGSVVVAGDLLFLSAMLAKAVQKQPTFKPNTMMSYAFASRRAALATALSLGCEAAFVGWAIRRRMPSKSDPV
jgi:hypothetical protein